MHENFHNPCKAQAAGICKQTDWPISNPNTWCRNEPGKRETHFQSLHSGPTPTYHLGRRYVEGVTGHEGEVWRRAVQQSAWEQWKRQKVKRLRSDNSLKQQGQVPAVTGCSVMLSSCWERSLLPVLLTRVPQKMAPKPANWWSWNSTSLPGFSIRLHFLVKEKEVKPCLYSGRSAQVCFSETPSAWHHGGDVQPSDII